MIKKQFKQPWEKHLRKIVTVMYGEAKGMIGKIVDGFGDTAVVEFDLGEDQTEKKTIPLHHLKRHA